MYPVKFVRENLELLKAAASAKNQTVSWTRLETLEVERRKLLVQLEDIKRRQNELTAQISSLKRQKQDTASLQTQAGRLADEALPHQSSLVLLEQEINDLISSIPNIPHESVPVSKDASANIVVRTWGDISKPDFNVLPHDEIGGRLGILDLARGAKITGSSFPVFRGNGALLVRALINFMLDLHRKNGFNEAWVPALVNRASLFGTGQLPKLEEDMYRLKDDDFFLIPTAEVPVTNLHRDEVIPSGDLPLYYAAYTPCFRREAGAYGKDTKGLIRLHQFDKVEMVKFVRPEESYNELETLVQEAERVLQALELPYRVVLLASGDMSFAASKCYDLEVWAPGIQRWLEVSSCSNFEAFQARRANIRYRNKKGAAEHVHTLNGSGVAFPRTIIGILENHQQKDGTVRVPDVLRPYMNDLKFL